MELKEIKQYIEALNVWLMLAEDYPASMGEEQAYRRVMKLYQSLPPHVQKNLSITPINN